MYTHFFIQVKVNCALLCSLINRFWRSFHTIPYRTQPTPWMTAQHSPQGQTLVCPARPLTDWLWFFPIFVSAAINVWVQLSFYGDISEGVICGHNTSEPEYMHFLTDIDTFSSSSWATLHPINNVWDLESIMLNERSRSLKGHVWYNSIYIKISRREKSLEIESRWAVARAGDR